MGIVDFFKDGVSLELFAQNWPSLLCLLPRPFTVFRFFLVQIFLTFNCFTGLFSYRIPVEIKLKSLKD